MTSCDVSLSQPTSGVWIYRAEVSEVINDVRAIAAACNSFWVSFLRTAERIRDNAMRLKYIGVLKES